MVFIDEIRSIVDVIRDVFLKSTNDEKEEMVKFLKKLAFISEITENNLDVNMYISLEENLLNQGYSMEEIHLDDCDMDDIEETERGIWWKLLSDEQKIILLDAEMEDYWNDSQSDEEYTNEQIIDWLLN
jgi:hypothetical protein